MNKDYNNDEIKTVLKETQDVLNKFEIRLDLLTADLNVATKHLGDISSLAALIDVRDRLNRIDLDTVIDTLRPLVESN